MSLRKEIPLVGHEYVCITGSKLPSKKQVLCVLFFNMRSRKFNLRDSATMVAQELMLFWEKARIPTVRKDQVIIMIESVYEERKHLMKSVSRRFQSQIQKENEFVDNLNDIFDIAHQNALTIITIEEDRNFLLLQRQKGRPGCMLGVDQVLNSKEKRRTERKEKVLQHRTKWTSDARNTQTDIISALDMLAEQGQWVRCLEKAKQINDSILEKYVALNAAQLLRDGEAAAALNLYLNYGATATKSNFNIYTRITLNCFGMHEQQTGVGLWKNLRDFLYRLFQTLKSSEYAETDFANNVEQFLTIAHFYAARAACRQIQSLQPIATRISIALLRYTHVIPVDKGFYEAGMDLRNAGRDAEAFVILNHYLDVCEAIEEGSRNLVDHTDLASTDFPNSVPLPEEIHLKQDANLHEEIREWVLAVSMDQQVDQALPKDDRGLYESSLEPNKLPCVLSAYPVRGRQPVTFKSSSREANRDVWSKFSVAIKLSPASDAADVVSFIGKWNGQANYAVH